MTEHADDRILNKIKKCLALSKSDNEGEASNALRQAQAMMRKYNVTPEGLAAHEVKELRAKSSSWAKPPRWEGILASVIADAFGCRLVQHNGHANMDNRKLSRFATFAFTGLKHNAELATYAYAVVHRQILRGRERHLATREDLWTRQDKMAAGETYCQEYIQAMRAKIHKLVLEPEQEKVINDKFVALYPPDSLMKYVAPSRGYDCASGDAARRDAKNAYLDKPVPGQERAKLK